MLPHWDATAEERTANADSNNSLVFDSVILQYNNSSSSGGDDNIHHHLLHYHHLHHQQLTFAWRQARWYKRSSGYRPHKRTYC